MVSLYDSFRGGLSTTTAQEVEAAATLLCAQFRVANARQGTRANAVLGQTGAVEAGSSVLSEATGQRLARALELLVASYMEVHGLEVPTWLQETPSSEDES